MDGTGLFHAIASYCGQFAISFVSCREMMPDPAFYSQCLRESFAELQAATSEMAGGATAKPKRKMSTSKARQRKSSAKAAVAKMSRAKPGRAPAGSAKA
jgi:hypothetical protein